MANREHHERGRGLTAFLGLLLLLSLAGALTYVLGQLNHQRYRLAGRDGHLVVERGTPLPVGFETWQPEVRELAQAYAAIPMPAGASYGLSDSFDDRAELDRNLFGILQGWARERSGSDPSQFELAVTYVERAELLPGLSEQQRTELRLLRGELAFRMGHKRVGDALAELSRARAEFRRTAELRTEHAEEAMRWASELEQRIAELAALAKPPAVKVPSAVATPSPPAIPTAP